MPKKAFFNLDEQKRAALMDKAMRLYVDYPYEKVTLQLILDTLSLHPTTFYRYFEDKDELYFYLYQEVTSEYLHRLVNEDGSGDCEYDIFSVYPSTLADGVLSEVQSAFFKASYGDIPREVLMRAHFGVFKDDLFRKYKDGLRRLQYEGKLRPGVDVDLISYMYATTMFNLRMFCAEAGIRDAGTIDGLKKYFYEDFFLHGISRGEGGEREG